MMMKRRKDYLCEACARVNGEWFHSCHSGSMLVSLKPLLIAAVSVSWKIWTSIEEGA